MGNYEFDMQIETLFKKLENRYGYSFGMYSLNDIKYRVKSFMSNENYLSFESFEIDVLEKFEIFENFLTYFSVSVTSFFRDPSSLKILTNEILPYLDSHSNIKVWCSGCSSGEEAYSIAIILYELNLLQKSQIYATDFNKFNINLAKNGIYSISNLNQSKKNYLESNGKFNFEDYIDINLENFKVKSFLKEKISFFNHNLINDRVLNEFQLILCRNVLIYFNDSLRNKVLKTFYNSLDKNGCLVFDKNEKYINKSIKKYFNIYKECILKSRWRRDFE